MAASFRLMNLTSKVLKFSRLLITLESKKHSLLRIYKTRFFRCNAFKKYFLLLTVPVVTVSTGDIGAGEKPFEPNDVRLRSSECLKNAAGLAVDSTSAVLSQTVYAIIKVEKEYVELLYVLVTLLEYQMQVLGQKAEEDRIADIVIETRHEINKVRERKQDLALLFASVEKLADATAEVAFATGSSYASTSAGERLYSAQQEIKRNLAESERAEKEVAYAEAQMIDRLTRHEEIKANQSKKDDIDAVDYDVTEAATVIESDDNSGEVNGERHEEFENDVKDDNGASER